MAYKRELIINNGSLTSYKKLLKVSDVCQLLDKSKYPATTTTNGVTFTNNGDGTITANGTVVSGHSYASYEISIPQFREVKNNHKYALFSRINNIINIGYIECIFFIGSGDSYFVADCVETNYAGTFGFTIPQGEYSSYQKIELRVRFGYTANNLVFKPQLFDLTEMYGAGNEPATVAEFKAKFPNDLYDYSPRCWVTSYKTGLIAKTKNLFDYIPPMRKEYDGANITYLESLSNGAIVTGAVGHEPGRPHWSNGWFSPAYSSYSNTPLTPLKSGDVITVSADCTLLKAYSASSMFTRILSNDDSKVSGSIVSIPLELGKTKRISQTFTIISDIDFRPVFTLNSNKVKITNIQIEKGSTATDYVPYGYL